MDQRTARTLSYFENNQLSEQWAPFLTALGGLLKQQMPTRDLRAFLRALGRRMAAEMPLPPCDTLDELEELLNAVWTEISWGWVALSEEESWINIEHVASPLKDAFSDMASEWSPALFEGLYAEWFKEFGAGDPLILAEVVDESAALNDSLVPLRFRLGHPSIFE